MRIIYLDENSKRWERGIFSEMLREEIRNRGQIPDNVWPVKSYLKSVVRDSLAGYYLIGNSNPVGPFDTKAKASNAMED